MSQANQWDIGDPVQVDDKSDKDHGREGIVTGQRYNFEIKDWTSEVHMGEEIREFRNRNLSSGDSSYKSIDQIESMNPEVGNPRMITPKNERSLAGIK